MAIATSYELHLAASGYTDILDEPLTSDPASIINYEHIPLVTLEESVKPIAHSFDEIEVNVFVSKIGMTNPVDGLSKDESRSIHLFMIPFDSGPCFSQVLNQALRDGNLQTLEPWFPFLKLFITALHKLPSQDTIVWRGVQGVDLRSKYLVGSKLIWRGVSLCTASIDVLESKHILGKEGLRTIFCIECKNGKSISSHSYFRDPKNQIVLMPGFYFEVLDHMNPVKDLYLIYLKEIQSTSSPLPAPKNTVNASFSVSKHYVKGRICSNLSDRIEQAEYDILISCAYQDELIIERIKNALPRHYCTHVKDGFSSRNIKAYLDNTGTAVIAVINRIYESSEICQADMVHIFKRQFPLVFVISEDDFKPTADWLSLVWNALNTQKVFLNSLVFGKNLCHALENAQWNLSSNLNLSSINQANIMSGSDTYLDDLFESIIPYNNPAQVSYNYRRFIADPLRINTDLKLRDFFDNYICKYVENSNVMESFKRGVNQNNVCHFIRACTYPSPFRMILNNHLARNVLFYFGSTLYDTVNYQLVKTLVDFISLCIYRPELQPYQFKGVVYRGASMSEENLLKYVVGSRFMNTTFLSTSRDRQIAEMFCGTDEPNFPVLCTYVIHNENDRRTALDISHISCIPDEGEIMVLPFSAFYVKSVRRSFDRSKPTEMVLIEDDSGILENINTIHDDDD